MYVMKLHEAYSRLCLVTFCVTALVICPVALQLERSCSATGRESKPSFRPGNLRNGHLAANQPLQSVQIQHVLLDTSPHLHGA